MKYINKIIIKIAGLFLVALFQTSCQKDSFTKANVNPNAPGTVVPANILPGVESALAYNQGGELTRFTNLFVQQMVGFSRQSEAFYKYALTSNDFNNAWGNMYTSVLGNNKDLQVKADAAMYNVYSGISRILSAYSLQLIVDSWGKVPYSQALSGSENTHPVYDDDKVLYDSIGKLVDVAILQLTNPEAGGQTPGADDLIYGGDVSKWIKFGHAIKARLYIHQSKGDAAMAAKAIAEANLTFTSNTDNAQFRFGNTETSANPIYQFNSQRGDIDYGAGTLADTLAALNDPRLIKLTTPDYTDVNGAGIGDYYGAKDAYVELITYEEILFIKAEATLRATGDYATAQQFYKAGIQASMDKLGVSAIEAAAYITVNGTLPITNIDAAIAKIAVQQWITLYQNPEAWTSWRRTGIPNLIPTAGTNGIPRRLLYPQNELSLNAANVPQATLYLPKIFWDK